MYKISWVAKESRPEASGSASILAQHLKAPTVSDVLIANRVVKFLRSSASQCLNIWRHDPKNLRVISDSDAGGIGGPPTENGENVQNAHLIMVADDGVRQKVHSKASTLMWRSARCKRAVNSTLAGETIAMSAALADAEWAQIMIQDILDQTVTVRNTTGGTLPFQVVLRSNCTLSKRLPHDLSIDAKSVFDALIKECAGNRQDRRTAVDLAIVRETLKAQGSHIRWIPHPLMPADSMTKADPSAGNDALRHLLRTGKLVWDEETIRQNARLGRTKAVSRRQLETNGKTLHGT